MKMRMSRFAPMIMAAVLIAGITVVSIKTKTPMKNGSEYINQGAPLLPEGFLEKSWFDRGDDAAVHDINPDAISKGALPKELATNQLNLGYAFKMRQKNGKIIKPLDVIIQEGDLTEGDKVYAGYTFRYPDKIIVGVDPSNDPVDPDAEAATTISPITTGETKINKKVKKGNSSAVFRKQADQKWESGDVNHIPAFLMWSEPTGLESPKYVHYLIMGDVSQEQLSAIADTLQ